MPSRGWWGRIRTCIGKDGSRSLRWKTPSLHRPRLDASGCLMQGPTFFFFSFLLCSHQTWLWTPSTLFGRCHYGLLSAGTLRQCLSLVTSPCAAFPLGTFVSSSRPKLLTNLEATFSSRPHLEAFRVWILAADLERPVQSLQH